MFGKEDSADIGRDISKRVTYAANGYILKPGGSLYERTAIFKRPQVTLSNKING